jgi:hypothetical protein
MRNGAMKVCTHHLWATLVLCVPVFVLLINNKIKVIRCYETMFHVGREVISLPTVLMQNIHENSPPIFSAPII